MVNEIYPPQYFEVKKSSCPFGCADFFNKPVVMFPEKFARANAMLAKWGIPKEWEEEILAEERKQAVWVKGTLSQADVDTNTFLIVVEATDEQPQKNNPPVCFNI